MSNARKYLSGLVAAYPGLLKDALVFAVFTAAFALRYYHREYIFQGDVFLNLYIRAYHGLFGAGWDPYAWGYLGWYPIYGGLFPLNIVTHGLIGLSGDSPSAALAFTQLNAALSLFALGFFTYLLMRFLGRSRGAGVLAAIIVSFTGFHVQAGLRELDIFYLHSFMFAPLVIIFLIKANRDKSLRSALAGGLMIGLSLLGGGNAPMFLFLPVFAFACLAVTNSGAISTLKALPGSFFYAFVALGVGMAIGSAMTMPSLAYMDLSSRPLFIENEAVAVYDIAGNLLTALFREWWNRGYYDHELDSFLGLPVILLALTGFALAWQGDKRKSGALLMLFTALVALVGMYVYYMPGPVKALLNFYFIKLSIRFPFRFFMVFLLAVGFFAANGLDALRERVERTRANLLIIMIVALATAIYVLVGYPAFYDGIANPARRASFMMSTVVAVIISILLITALLRNRIGLGGIQAYVPQAIVLSVFIFYLLAGADAPTRNEASQGFPRFYPATIEKSIEHFFYEPAVEWNEYTANERKPFRIFDRGLELRKNVWAPLTKADIAFEPYNDPASSGALTKFAESVFEGGFKPSSPLVDLYNVKFLKYREFKDYKETSSRVIVNDDAFERFFVTHNAKYFSNESALFAGLKNATREDLRSNVFLVSSGTSANAVFEGDYEDVEILKRSPTEIRLKADMRSPGWLVSSELWFPAWTSIVDGSPARILKAYGAFRAVRLESGPHEIEFSFSDPYARAGKIITLVVIVCVLGAIFLPLKREKK